MSAWMRSRRRVPAPDDALAQRFEEALGTVEHQRHFGNQHEIRLRAGERGIRRDEAGIATHELDDADAVRRAFRLRVRAVDHLHRFGNGGFETEALVEQNDVVVDRFRNADDGLFQPAELAFVGNFARRAQRAVPADDEKNVDAHALQRVDDGRRVLLPAGTRENGAALRVNVGNGLRVQQNRLMVALRHKPFVAVAETVDARDAVGMAKPHDEVADHVVQARAKAAAGHDADFRFRRIEENVLARSRHLEGRQRLALADGFHHAGKRNVLKNAVGIRLEKLFGKVKLLERRRKAARAEIFDRGLRGDGIVAGGRIHSA